MMTSATLVSATTSESAARSSPPYTYPTRPSIRYPNIENPVSFNTHTHAPQYHPNITSPLRVSTPHKHHRRSPDKHHHRHRSSNQSLIFNLPSFLGLNITHQKKAISKNIAPARPTRPPAAPTTSKEEVSVKKIK